MFNFTTAADVIPTEFPNWYIFNTWLQKAVNHNIRLRIPISFSELHQVIKEEQADIAYANPYDAAMLVRDHGFVPIVRPDNQTDEMVIVTAKNNPIDSFTELAPGTRIALTDDRDVRMIGMILIEPADLNEDNVNFVQVESGVVASRRVINNDADIAFILTKSYDIFSPLITNSLRELIRSQISVINHTLMVKPHVLDKIPDLPKILTEMHTNAGGKKILDYFSINQWVAVEDEEVEFMIDLMETLK